MLAGALLAVPMSRSDSDSNAGLGRVLSEACGGSGLVRPGVRVGPGSPRACARASLGLPTPNPSLGPADADQISPKSLSGVTQSQGQAAIQFPHKPSTTHSRLLTQTIMADEEPTQTPAPQETYAGPCLLLRLDLTVISAP